MAAPAATWAGVTVTALASFGPCSELAGVSPVNGLYALLGPTLAYVLLGSSRRLVIGPEGSVSTLVAAAVLPLAVASSGEAAELASMLALLVAACFLLARALRLGWVAEPGADRLPARGRCGARDLAARQAARGSGRGDRAATAAVGGGARD